MKNDIRYYSVGALLYCPANRWGIVEKITAGTFGTGFSLALCLEDTIGERFVEEAERILAASVAQLHRNMQTQAFYLPKIFIRVRNPGQIARLLRAFGKSVEIITGFIVPKFAPANAGAYTEALIKAIETTGRDLYLMPIYESASLTDLRMRYDILYGLKDCLARIEKNVLCIRVGGNDLCHIFGFRRHVSESIHKIRPVADIFSDIITVYGMDYVVSGPVWEYYSGDGWREGLMQELRDDRLCGFTGKTVIHPDQIPVVNEAYKVSRRDLDDAQSILSWEKDAPTLVSGSPSGERMNEYKTHTHWAKRMLFLSRAFGIRD